MIEIWEDDGDFSICKNCQMALLVSPWDNQLRNVKVLEEREDKRGDIAFLKIEAECPHCFHRDYYIGGEENKWLEVHYCSEVGAKKMEMVLRLQEEALRKRVLQLQRQTIQLQQELEESKKKEKLLNKDNKRLADIAYGRLSAEERRDLR